MKRFLYMRVRRVQRAYRRLGSHASHALQTRSSWQAPPPSTTRGQVIGHKDLPGIVRGRERRPLI